MAKTTKSETDMMYKTKILFLIVLGLLIAYLIFASKKTAVIPTTPTPAIQNGTDLQSAGDELNYVNVDSTDAGLNDLDTEVSSFSK